MFENRVFSSVESKFPPSLIVTSRGLHRQFFTGGGSGPFLESPENFLVRQTISVKLRVPNGGSWSPGALKFLLWSPEPYHFTD